MEYLFYETSVLFVSEDSFLYIDDQVEPQDGTNYLIKLELKTLIILIKKIMKLIKNIKLGKNSFFLIKIFLYIFIFSSILIFNLYSQSLNNEKIVLIKILDKVSSKNTKLEIEIGKEKKFKNLLIKILKCKNSEFDDNPEITAYIQVRDLTNKNNNEVFVFNGWMFSSSPSITPFDHPVYDVWLISCY